MEPFQLPLCFIGWLPKLALFVYLSHPSFWSINSLPNQRIDVISDIKIFAPFKIKNKIPAYTKKISVILLFFVLYP